METVSLSSYFTTTEESKFNCKKMLRVAKDMKQNEVNTAVLMIISMARGKIPVTKDLDGKYILLLLDKWSCVIPASKDRFYVLAISILIKSEAVLEQKGQ